MRISLNNFKGVKQFDTEGERIRVTGKNGSGKSSILRSIEWALFGTMEGRKKGTLPVRVGAEDCYVEFESGGEIYSRMKKSGDASTEVYLRSVMFCNLIDQQPRYIKEVLSDVFLKDYAEELFGEYREGNIEKTAKSVRFRHKSLISEHERLKGRIDTFNELLASDKYANLDEDELERMERELLGIQKERAKYNIEGTKMGIDNTIGAIKVIKELIAGQQQSKERLLQEYKKKEKMIVDLTGGRCPTCGSKRKVEQGVLDSLAKDMKDIKHDGLNLGSKLRVNEAKLVELEDRKLLLTQKVETQTKGMNQQISNPDAYVKRITLYRERLKERFNMELEREKAVERIIELSDSKIMKAFEYLAPKGALNKKLNEVLDGILDGYDITLFEESSRDGEQTATFKVYRNGISYKQLSRSERLKANILLSGAILDKLEVELPLVIDDFEVFNSTNKKEIINILTNKNRQFITAEVSNAKLKAIEYAVAGA